MTLRLTPEALAAAYDYLSWTPPFSRWIMPPSKDIDFVIGRRRDRYGHHTVKGGRHEISISMRKVGHTVTLMTTMAHEMLHVRQAEKGVPENHGPQFRKWAASVCKYHGFDPLEF